MIHKKDDMNLDLDESPEDEKTNPEFDNKETNI
jgi:hypothetical protein